MNESPRTVAVTGATGFVGRHVCALLAQSGFSVLPLSRLASGAMPHWSLTASVADSMAHLACVDAVVHLAARVPANYEDLGEAAACYEINALGTLNLIQAARAAGVSHFVHVSTAALYTPSEAVVDERSPTIPQRAVSYLASKLAAEAYVAAVSFRGGLQSTVLRLAAVYGPGMSTSGLLPACVRQLKATGRFVVADANRFRTDLVHVSDVAAAVMAVLRRRATGTFNIASGNSVSPLDLARLVARHLRTPEDGISVAPASDLHLPVHTAISIGKARAELGLQPLALSEGLANYIESLS